MPKLNNTQEVALDILDFIYFYDVVSLTAFRPTGENEAVLKHLNELIAEVIAVRGLSGKGAEIYKHFLFCNIEMISTFNINREVVQTGEIPLSKGDLLQMVRQLHENAQDVFLVEVENAGFEVHKFVADVNKILAETNIENMPNAICYGLVGQALSFDFDGCIAGHVYRKFLDIKIFETKKNNLNNAYDQVKNEHAFLRAILFIEFEVMRNKLFHKNDRPGYMIRYQEQQIPENRIEKEKTFLLKTYNFYRKAVNSDFLKIYKYNVSNKEELEIYLSNVEVHLCHKRFFSQNHSKWASLFGLWYLKYHEIVNKNLPIFDVNNDNTCSALASDELKRDLGLTIYARSLYNYHVKYHNYFCFMAQAVDNFRSSEKQGFVSLPTIYPFNYHPDLSEKLLEIFDDFDRDIQ